jgi:hypothetical protein
MIVYMALIATERVHLFISAPSVDRFDDGDGKNLLTIPAATTTATTVRRLLVADRMQLFRVADTRICHRQQAFVVLCSCRMSTSCPSATQRMVHSSLQLVLALNGN